MDDFNEDNLKIDAALEDLSSGKVDQEEFDRFSLETNTLIAGKANVQDMLYTVTVTYENGFFEITGLPVELPDIITIRFTAPATFSPEDKLLIGTTEIDVLAADMQRLNYGAFAQGALVSLNVDFTKNQAFLAVGCGRVAQGKQFHVFDLPPSKILAQPAEWNFESYPGGDITDIRGVQTVGDESYLFADKAVYVYNHLNGEMSRYSHVIATSADTTCAAYTLDDYVCFEGGYESNTFSVAINTDTKRIQQIPTTSRPTCVIPDKNGSVYAFGGFVETTTAYNSSSATSVYTAKRGSGINSEWDTTSVAKISAQRTGTSTAYRYTAPRSAAGYSDGFDIWFGVSTPRSNDSYIDDYSIYRYSIAANTLLRTNGIPAFCTAGSTAIPYGFEYAGKYYGVHGRKVAAYDFISNTIDPSIAIPDVPVDCPNLVSVYKDTWFVFTAHGIYRLVFVAEGIPEDVGGVLEIYAGQQYRAEKTMAIRDKIILTPQWQTAAEDIVIKLGEYTGHGKVYVKTV
jgi:hypothetical protein